MNKIKLLVMLLFGFIAITCSEDNPTEPERTFFDIQGENGFVGNVDGTNALVSILIGESEGVVYVCNGEEGISEWFKGTINDPTEFTFANTKGSNISGKFEDNSYIGEVTLSTGNKHTFLAISGTQENSGIYRVMGEEADEDQVEAGWILNSTGMEKGSLLIGSVFQKTIVLPKTNVIIKNKSYPVFHFLIKKPTPPAPFVPVPYPNIR